ncbi:hypothetical protein NY78_3883 [Desulfovibrio sp. TomC]|nr:hypothetical protein NY78_3883 [Desulfovibrio sp. TomC]
MAAAPGKALLGSAATDVFAGRRGGRPRETALDSRAFSR